MLLLLCGYGVHVRNKVWRSEETLWLDDVEKCPRNGRGLMNYGLTQMAIGAYPAALDYFQRALIYTPNYPTLEVNLGIVQGQLHHAADAELHFVRAIALAPANDETHFYYGRWLFQTGRVADAVRELAAAVQLNPARLQPYDLLAAAYMVQRHFYEGPRRCRAGAHDRTRRRRGQSDSGRAARAECRLLDQRVAQSISKPELSGMYRRCAAGAEAETGLRIGLQQYRRRVCRPRAMGSGHRE